MENSSVDERSARQNATPSVFRENQLNDYLAEYWRGTLVASTGSTTASASAIDMGTPLPPPLRRSDRIARQPPRLASNRMTPAELEAQRAEQFLFARAQHRRESMYAQEEDQLTRLVPVGGRDRETMKKLKLLKKGKKKKKKKKKDDE